MLRSKSQPFHSFIQNSNTTIKAKSIADDFAASTFKFIFIFVKFKKQNKIIVVIL